MKKVKKRNKKKELVDLAFTEADAFRIAWMMGFRAGKLESASEKKKRKK